MGESLITRRAGAGGGGEATITFDNYIYYSGFEKL